MRPSVKQLSAGLQFHGEVDGKRQHYYVLSSPRQYFVMSFALGKRAAGYFNLVTKTDVDDLYHRLRGQQGVTAPTVSRRSRARRLANSSLTVLNMLYVLVATGRARIDKRRTSAALFFNVKP